MSRLTSAQFSRPTAVHAFPTPDLDAFTFHFDGYREHTIVLTMPEIAALVELLEEAK